MGSTARAFGFSNSHFRIGHCTDETVFQNMYHSPLSSVMNLSAIDNVRVLIHSHFARTQNVKFEHSHFCVIGSGSLLTGINNDLL